MTRIKLKVLAAALICVGFGAARANDVIENACLFSALARVPQVAGLKVVGTSVELNHTVRMDYLDLAFHDVRVTVNLGGRRARYIFQCRDTNGQVQILRSRVQ